MLPRRLLPCLLACACTSAESRPSAPRVELPPPSGAAVRPAIPEKPEPPPLEDDPDVEELDPSGALVPMPVADPIATALSPDDPFIVVIVDRKSIGRDILVLFAIEVTGEPSYAWEVARLHEGATAVEVLARTRIWGPAPGDLPEDDVAHKFKVYDVDNDKRSEVTIIVPVDVAPHDDEAVEGDGEVGAIFDARDLHVQFAVTRRLDTRREEVFDSESHATTTWVAKDLDGDHHPDLSLTTNLMDKDNNGCDLECDDEEAAERPRRSRATQVCPYEIAGDRWVCPTPQLGLELLAGNDGVRPIVGDALDQPDAPADVHRGLADPDLE